MKTFNLFKLIQNTPYLGQLIVYLRVPVAIALVAALVFSKVDQTIEVYRAIALDKNGLYEAAISLSWVSVLAVFVWYTSRFLLLERDTSYKQHPWANGLEKWSPRLLGITPLAGLGFGILAARNESINPKAQAFLMNWLIASLISGVVLLVLFWKRTDWFNQNRLGASSQGEGLFSPRVEIALANVAYLVFAAFSLPLIAAASSRFSAGVIAVFVVSSLLNLLLYSWHSQLGFGKLIGKWWFASIVVSLVFVIGLPTIALPNLVGSVSVVAIALTSLVIAFSSIYNWALKNRIPALTILVAIALVSSFFNLNDNHQFRQLASRQTRSLPELATSFEQWLASRPDRDRYAGKPYPVYLASTQGGGIFAAYHAATTLAKLTEAIPSFPQHIFAITGVSGGNLGASVYTSLIQQAEKRDQPLSQQASQVFDQELLSHLLTMAFFPDLIQRFIPFSINDWDRANGLEVAFEKGWGNQRENPLKQSFYQQWQPQGIAPALVFNATIVETGQRLLISPFEMPLGTQNYLVLEEPDLDLRLSTAAGLSARFPFVTPAGWYRRGSDGSKLRLVDGGYFDNSGIPTALDMGRVLQKLDGYGKRFELVYLAIVDQPSEKLARSSGLNEILSPIFALFNARDARSLNAIEYSTYTLNDGITDPFKLKFRALMLNKISQNPPIRLPLGWQLSTASKEFIYNQAPQPSECNGEKFRGTWTGNLARVETRNHNNCVAKSIRDELS